MSANAGGSQSTTEKRNELNQATQAKDVKAAIHDVGAFIGLLFAVDKLSEIWSRSPVTSVVLIIIAAGFLIYVAVSRTRDWKSMSPMQSLVEQVARDEDKSVTDTNNGDG